MPFRVPAAKASIKQNLFEFTIPGSKKVYSLPLMQYISADFSERLAVLASRVKSAEQHEDKDAMPLAMAESTSLQREIVEHYCPGLYERLSNDQIGALMDAWRQESSVGLGESSPSAKS
ncbi:hypothetical protein [Actinomyces ruminis]|uniref:Uncharacterized protein n=1 Tax=Actinomyces ruminis TaxID=1937003 RepID=A0ABX4MAX4_9ACTO|nr:hypothetical protein [Actinomyces ruminis]PHP52595.1 hypothetical protein BW737_008930 [Actinomyces ruminis]